MIKYLEFYEFCINSFGMCKSSRGSAFGVGGGGNIADYQWFSGRVSVGHCLHWKIVDFIGCFRFCSSSWIYSQVLGLHPKQTASLSGGMLNNRRVLLDILLGHVFPEQLNPIII